MRRLLWIVTAACTISLLTAQTTGGTGGAGGGGTGGTGGGGTGGGVGGGGGTGGLGGGGTMPGGMPGRNTNPFPQDQPRIPEMPQTIFLSGKVMLDDGTPPPEPVTIERICNGQPRPEGYTDSKGRFSFQLGQRNNGMLADASTSNMDGGFDDPFGGGFGGSQRGGRSAMGGSMGSAQGMRIQLMGCELRANLPGYQSSLVSLSNRNPLDNPDVGTIILKRLGNREGSVFSATNAFAPKEAKKAMDKGRELVKKKKVDEARKEFAKAVELYPKYSAAWFELGKIQQANGEIDDARKSFGQSLAADPKYTPPYQHLYMMSVKENKWEDVSDITARLLKLNPFDFPDAYYYNAVSNYNLKRLDDAEKSAKSLVDQNNKRFARADYILGLVLAQKEDFAAAASHIKKYLAAVPDAPDREKVGEQLSEIEKFASAKQD